MFRAYNVILVSDISGRLHLILNWRVQRSIPGDNYVIDKVIVLILAFIIDVILCVADSSCRLNLITRSVDAFDPHHDEDIVSALPLSLHSS